MPKKLAICLYGHLRTYKQTFESFFENLIKPNEQDDYTCDIFIHTWDIFEKSGFSWHNHFKELDGKKLSKDDIAEFLRIYSPKKFLIQTQKTSRAADISLALSFELVKNYERQKNIKYDYYLATRPDLYFATPLRLDTYIGFYADSQMQNFKLPSKHIFCAQNFFGRMPVADPRCICESDLLFFGNFNPLSFPNEQKAFTIPINYKIHKDFFLQRVGFRYNYTDFKDRFSAELIVKNHLAFKIGFVLDHCENLWDYLNILSTIFYIYTIHKKECKPQNKIGIDLNTCFDYEKAMKIKNSSTYKLGEKFIKIYQENKTLGVLKFIFWDLKNIKKSF